MKRILSILLIISVLMSISSCKEEKKDDLTTTDTITNGFNEEEFFSRLDQTKVAQINAIVEGFTSTVETAAMIKNSHIEFSKDYLLSTTVADNYETNIKKALGLGLLSADLGYLNIYRKTGQMVDYLVSINNLAGDLRVSQFFDFQTLKKLVTTGDNMDSLLFLTVSSFHQIENYFTQSNRSYLTVLSVTGVWIETQYLLTQVAKDNPAKDFSNQIGSQKDLLNQLIEIIKVYKGHPQFDYILENMQKLQKVYDEVKIEIEHGEAKVEFIDGNKVIYPAEETKVTISPETMQKIISTTEEVRNAIVNIK